MWSGERMKRIRKEKGLTLKQVSELLNLSISAVSQYERDVLKPTPIMIVKIANVLSCKLDELVDDKDLIVIRKELQALTSDSKAFSTIQKVKERIIAVLEEQADHFEHLMQIRTEFIEEGFLPRFKDEILTENMYTAISALFGLNAEGQRKAIDYLFDLNKIIEYRNEAFEAAKEDVKSGEGDE